MNLHTARFACLQKKRGSQILQASNSTNAANGMTGASAALVGSSRNTVSLTAPTKRVTYQPIKSRPLSFSKCWLGSRHAANDGSGRSLATSDFPQKRLIIFFLTVFPIRSTIDQLLETPQFREQPSPQLKCLSSRSRTHQNLVYQRA